MRRVTRRRILLLITVSALATAGSLALRDALDAAGADAAAGLPGDARHSLTYILEPGAPPLVFPLAPGHEGLRLLTTANLAPDAMPGSLLEPLEAAYTLEYTLLDGRGEPMVDTPRLYHEKAIHDPLARRDALYLGTSDIPAPSQNALIDLSGAAAAVAVRLVTAEPPISDVGLRAYAREPVSSRDLDTRWRRLTRDQQARLHDGSVYPPELARREERRSLVTLRWAPLGPRGINGIDYRTRPLFLLGDETEPTGLPARPEGVVAGPDGRASIPLPPGGGELVLDIQPASPLGDAPSVLALEWFPHGAGVPRRWRLDMDARRTRWRQALDAGVVVVTSAAPVVVQARLAPRDAPETVVDITPEPILALAWRTDVEPPPHWHLTTVPGQRLPVRLDLRAVRPVRSPARDRTATVAMLDTEGAVLRLEHIDVAFRDAPFEQTPAVDDLELGHPVRTFLQLGPDVRGLRVTGSGIAASLYVRPPALPLHTRVPTDYYAFPVSPPSPAVWYGLTPTHPDALTRAGGRLLLSLASEPEPPDPDLLAGRYDFDRLRPSGEPLSRQLLLPRAGGSRVRDAGVGAWLTPIEAGVEQRIDPRADPLVGAPRPELLWRTAMPVTGAIRIELGAALHEFAVAGTRGSLLLPAMPPGPIRLRVTGPVEDTQLWLSHAGRSTETLDRLRRTASRVRAGSVLEFVIDKGAGEETLTLALYRPLPVQHPARVQVELPDLPTAPDRASDYTVRTRTFEVQPAFGPAAIVVDGDGPVDAGEPFFVRMGAEVPPGRYRMRVRLLATEPGLLAAWRIRPGTVPRDRFVLETIRATGEDAAAEENDDE